jgi:Spy/CpxP family protein refolding chaperone
MDNPESGVLSRDSTRRLVMKALSAVLTLVLTVSVCAGLPATRAAQPERRGRFQEALAERIQDLNLTDEQETKIADIRKDGHPKIQEAAKELAAVVKDEVDKAMAVLNGRQKQRLAGLREERKQHRAESLAERIANLESLDLTDHEMTQIDDIRKEYRPKVGAALRKLTGLLTAEQKQARADGLRAGKRRREVREALKLTTEQKEKLEAVGNELRTLVRDEMEKIRAVLSPEQQEKLEELKQERRQRVRDRLAWRISNLKDLDLTDAQVAKLTDIRKEYRPKVHEAGNKLRAAVRGELAAILAVIKG